MSDTRTWKGREVIEHIGTFDEVMAELPTFRCEPFAIEGAENKYLDMIIREGELSFTDDGHRISPDSTPLAAVSKGYSLVQHTEVMETSRDVLETLGYFSPDNKWELNITEYGERIWITVNLAEDFDPGDGHLLKMQLNVRNSVDRSALISFDIGWYRLICANGMVVLDKGVTVRRRHTKHLSMDALVGQLTDNLAILTKEKEIYSEWHETPIKVGQGFLEDWVNATVSSEWGVHKAARCYHILKTGMDGKPDFKDSKDKVKRLFPYSVGVSSDIDVPGSKPAESVLDVAHALSWVASRQNSIQTRFDMMRDVPPMMRKLKTNMA